MKLNPYCFDIKNAIIEDIQKMRNTAHQSHKALTTVMKNANESIEKDSETNPCDMYFILVFLKELAIRCDKDTFVTKASLTEIVKKSHAIAMEKTNAFVFKQSKLF